MNYRLKHVERPATVEAYLLAPDTQAAIVAAFPGSKAVIDGVQVYLGDSDIAEGAEFIYAVFGEYVVREPDGTVVLYHPFVFDALYEEAT